SQASEALKNMLPSYVRVIRDGQEQKILTQDVVPGEIILLEEGDRISADARLIKAEDLQIDQSTLTGESRAVRKNPQALAKIEVSTAEYTNIIYAGTNVAQGSAKALVFATGMTTQFGTIAALTQVVKEDLSPLQQQLNRLTKQISFIAISLGVIFFLAAVFFVKEPVAQSFVFALGMIVAFIPEGLLPTVTLSLAMAVQRMAKKNALVKKLSAVETLGSTSVICTDKTGTLTQNEMTVSKLYVGEQEYRVTGVGYAPTGTIINDSDQASGQQADVSQFIQAAALCSNARVLPPSAEQLKYQVLGDPTEASLLVLAQKNGEQLDQLTKVYPRLRELAFESRRKRMTTIHQVGTTEIAFCKGAPKEVLELCTMRQVGQEIVSLTPTKRAEIMAVNDQYARQGLRVLAVATRKLPLDQLPRQKSQYTNELIEQNLTFLGLIAMSDPPRPEVTAAVAKCYQAGIKIIMMTGDYGLTAESIARQIGIVTTPTVNVVSGLELAALSDEQLQALVLTPVIFARVAPEQKLRVVQALQEQNQIVAVTGDGVNDAPALKKADIGVAMGIMGSDVAKESADMILLDDNFASIVSAIEEGRAVYQNIRRFILYILNSNVPEAIPSAMFLLSRGGIPLPLTIMQILAIDLGTDMVPALGLGVEKVEADVMLQPPRDPKERLLNRPLLIKAFLWYGMLEAGALAISYFFVNWLVGWPNVPLAGGIDPIYVKATTMALGSIVFCQIGVVLNCRTQVASVFSIGLFSNRRINIGIIVEVVLFALIVYVPFLQTVFQTTALAISDWLFLCIWPILIFGIEELRKAVMRLRNQRRNEGKS
ncbi:MAG: cation-translocating P-type ATPase, partial [Culicoidibacterales bacterium]